MLKKCTDCNFFFFFFFSQEEKKKKKKSATDPGQSLFLYIVSLHRSFINLFPIWLHTYKPNQHISAVDFEVCSHIFA